MAVVFTEYRRVGVDPPPMIFEADLIEMCRRVGRPTPEIKGAKVHTHPEGDRTWLVVCTLRGGVVPPHSDELSVEVLERTWTEGIVRVLQESLGRLASYHRAVLGDSPFRFFGGRDSEGLPTLTPAHADFGGHMQDMEALLHHTQTSMDRARMKSDLQVMELRNAKQDLQVSVLERTRLLQIKRATQVKNKRLQRQLKTLQDELKRMESKIEELEEETEELRKENESLLNADGDIPMEEFDMEPESEQDDDDLGGDDEDEEDPEEVIPEEDEEDPEEVIPEEETVIQEDTAGHHNGIIYE